jgi:hypothetical protein
MPVHIEEMTTEVTVLDGDLPFSEAQLEKLVKIVINRLERQQRAAKDQGAATSVRTQSAPSLQVNE